MLTNGQVYCIRVTLKLNFSEFRIKLREISRVLYQAHNCPDRRRIIRHRMRSGRNFAEHGEYNCQQQQARRFACSLHTGTGRNARRSRDGTGPLRKELRRMS